MVYFLYLVFLFYSDYWKNFYYFSSTPNTTNAFFFDNRMIQNYSCFYDSCSKNCLNWNSLSHLKCGHDFWFTQLFGQVGKGFPSCFWHWNFSQNHEASKWSLSWYKFPKSKSIQAFHMLWPNSCHTWILGSFSKRISSHLVSSFVTFIHRSKMPFLIVSYWNTLGLNWWKRSIQVSHDISSSKTKLTMLCSTS